MTNFLKEFIDYLDDNKNKIEITLFEHLTMDDGSEFKSDFTELLEQE
jgi:IS30 family transposase